jgi:hypothetical protein
MIRSCLQDSKMTDNADFALDRQSNVRLFERLANPHMLDDRRLEEVKQLSVDMPFNLPRGVLLERDDESPVPTEIDESPRTSARGSSRSSSSRASPRPSSRASSRVSSRSSGSRHSAAPQRDPSPVSEPRLSARSQSSVGSNRIDRKHHRFQSNHDDLLPPTRTQPPPLPHMDDELERLRSRTYSQGPNLAQMRERHQQRQQARELTPMEDIPTSSGGSYDALFRKMCQMRKRGGAIGPGGEYRPMSDPDYAEKRELLIKLDELRNMGFNVPKMDPSMPLEDLQTEITRRTVSMGTVETVDTVIGYICSGATILETINNMAGPFLPMENYAQSVKAGTQTPRFKYAMYQLVLRYQGRNSGNPWRVVLMVMLAPLLQGALIKFIQWLMKGRTRIGPGMISTGLKSLFSLGKKDDPNKGVPTGIPGISPDMPQPSASNAAPAAPTAAAPSNPFASFFRSAAKTTTTAPTNVVSTNLPPTAPVADGPVTKPRRMRLQRPSELSTTDMQSEVGVMTPDQMN